MEDGQETKSDFIARMFMMGRLEIDPEKKTFISNTTCTEETGETMPPEMKQPAPKQPALLPPKTDTKSPIICSFDKTEGCQEYNVVAKGFFSAYEEIVGEEVLNGARSLIFEASSGTDISLEPDGEAVKNEANYIIDEWHHRYDVKFKVAATEDPKAFLSEFFESNIKQMGEAAVKISYVQTEKL